MFFPRNLQMKIEESIEDNQQLRIKHKEALKTMHHLLEKLLTERSNIDQQRWVNLIRIVVLLQLIPVFIQKCHWLCNFVL